LRKKSFKKKIVFPESVEETEVIAEIAHNDETWKGAEAVLNLEETTNEVILEDETAKQI